MNGGICGSNILNTSLNINKCIYNGDISGDDSGGIIGHNIGDVSSSIIINNTIVNANIDGSQNGGICGSYCGINYSNTQINNCSVSGLINGFSAGGICGSYFGNNYGIANINNCLVTGDLLKDFIGGICGSYCASNYGNVNINKCLYVGQIINTIQHGAICGSNCADTFGTVHILNSYGGYNDYQYFIINNIGTDASSIIYTFWDSNSNIDINILTQYNDLLTTLIYVSVPYMQDSIFFQNGDWLYNENDVPSLNGQLDVIVNRDDLPDFITYIGYDYPIINNINLPLNNTPNQINITLTDKNTLFPEYTSPNYIIVNMDPSGTTFESHIGFKFQVPVINGDDFKVYYNDGINTIDISKNNTDADDQYFIQNLNSGIITFFTKSFSSVYIDFSYVLCIGNDSLILMADNTYKRIDKIRRGDIVKCYKKDLPVSRIKYTKYTKNIYCNYTIIPKGTVINNTIVSHPLLITGYHPILINNMRLPVEHLKFPLKNNNMNIYLDCKLQPFDSSNFLCDLQFDEPTYYNANGIWIQSSSPYTSANPLPYELYWDKSYYKNILTTDDPDSYDEPLILKPVYNGNLNIIKNNISQIELLLESQLNNIKYVNSFIDNKKKIKLKK